MASRFISEYFNDTLQFQTTLAYLADPPQGYQQPAVDIFKGLAQIQQDIDRGAFANQYQFEATLQNLIYSAHDAHLQLAAGILDAFTFASPYSLISLSTDGVQIPKIYNIDDLDGSNSLPSAIKSINGQDVVTYLKQFGAANSIGNLEPNADFNDLMSSFAAVIQDDFSVLEAYIEFFPGETISLEYENGTVLPPIPWQAIYNSPGPTGPLTTGGDFYNFFVLGFFPASFDPDAPDPCAAADDSADSTATATTDTTTAPTTDVSASVVASATSFPDSSYPDTADVFQPDLYPDGFGFVTGYFLKDESLAVLSIPTFDMLGNDTQTFSDTVGKFLDEAQKAGMKKVLIDLQENFGGDTLLAIDTFKHFFPDSDPFRGSRLRAHEEADVLGNTFTTYFQQNRAPNSSVYNALAVSDWVAIDRLNADTNQNFTSWPEFFGPHPYHGDFFTTVQRENISSSVFDEGALGVDIFNAIKPQQIAQPYDPENIILLTDGLCSSACAIFVEAMHHDAGVKAVVVGGLPAPGPMQIAGGSRGAEIYSADYIDLDIEAAEFVNATTSDVLPNRTTDFFISDFTINLRDQIRKNQYDVPLQFVYDAADCRIFYTAETYINYTKLWSYAARAVDDPTLCVAGSTGFATTGGNLQQASPAPASPPKNDDILGTKNQFTPSLSPPGVEHGLAVPAAKPAGGKIRTKAGTTTGGKTAVKVTCNNSRGAERKVCSTGTRCSLGSTVVKTETVNGVNNQVRNGNCIADSTPRSSFFDQPGQIIGDGSLLNKVPTIWARGQHNRLNV